MYDNISWIHIILILLVTIAIGYLFGIFLVQIIDNRLSKIKLNIPKQEVVIQYPEHFENQKPKKEEILETKTFQNNSNKQLSKTNFDKDFYNMIEQNEMVEGFENDFAPIFKDWTYLKQEQYEVCFKNHQHVKNGKNTGCLYGVTNYQDPKDMSPIDIKIFTLNYPSNMTMQDYVNWLWCFEGREDQLPYNHLKNLEKMKIGKKLVQENGVCPPPSYYFPSISSEQYFQKMYNDATNEFSVAGPLNSTTGPMLGYNYDEYSEFAQNQDVLGRSGELRNPEIPIQKNAKKLRDFIFPKDSNFIKMDDEYEIYHVKNVEI